MKKVLKHKAQTWMLKNMSLTKLKSGRSRMKLGSNLSGKTNVNEEYKEAFRTKSYVEMWSQIPAGQLEKYSSFDRLPSSSSLPYSLNLSEHLLQPRQDKLEDLNNFDPLLLDYFESGLEACHFCELLLGSIHQTRVYYQRIRRVIKISKRVQEFSSDEQYCSAILKELAGFALLENPLSIIRPVQFREIHETNVDLFRKLTSKRGKIKRKAKYRRISRQIGSICLVISHTTLVIALLALAFHSMIGIIAAPGLAACFFGIKKTKDRSSSHHKQGPNKRSLLERLGAQLDILAKGIYILINDFDTISRLVWRLNDEIEHRKAIARMCIRNGKLEVLKEVVREFCIHDSSFLEQLKELEEHTKLCFHTINRSRRLVIQEIVDSQAQ